jgi:SagB-type dehydrogenase family enzyme
MSLGVGDRFQKETKYFREKMLGGYLDWSNRPSAYKHFSNSKIVELPLPEPAKNFSLEAALRNRRSTRDFSPKPMNLRQLSLLLWASTGIQNRIDGHDFRTAPSAGALYPIETYVVSNNVEGLRKALFHYSIEHHWLEELQEGDLALPIARAALDQEMFAKAAVIFLWTAIFGRSKWKYRQRAYRYVYLDAGHIAQNLALAATGSGLGSCQVGAFFDDEVNNIIGIDGEEESAIYLSIVGYPATRDG